MADNVTYQSSTLASLPSGTVVSTDEGAGGHVQRVKLCLSADGSETHISADANGLEMQGPGTAGTAAGGVLTVQGQTGMTALDVTVASALPAGTNAIGKLAANSGVDIGDVDVTSIAAGDNNIGNVDIVTVPAPLSTTGGGTEATALRVTIATDSTGVVSVDDNGGALTVDNGGTFAVQESGGALTALQLIDNTIKADDAGFTVATDMVSMAGALAVAHNAAPDAADAADAVALIANRHRVLFTIGGHPNVKAATYLTTGAGTDDNVLAAIGSGTKYVITRITITLDEAATVGVAVRLGFGTSVVPALPSTGSDAVDDIILYHPGMVPGSGIHMGDGSGIIAVGGDGAELRITNEAPTGGTLIVSVSYYTIES